MILYSLSAPFTVIWHKGAQAPHEIKDSPFTVIWHKGAQSAHEIKDSPFTVIWHKGAQAPHEIKDSPFAWVVSECIIMRTFMRVYSTMFM